MPPVVYILALAAFAVGTAEFILSGLLPAFAADMNVTIPVAGLLVTAYAACVAIASPVVAALTARVPRKTMLIVVLTVFIAGQVICALASDYAMVLAARLFVACAHGLFFSVALIIVGNAAPEARQGRAFSVFFAGLTLATIFGLPGGTAIGNAFGWRAAFWFVAAISTLATFGAMLVVPRDRPDDVPHSDLRTQIRQVMKQDVSLSYLAIIFDLFAYFCFLTYQVPYLGAVTGIPEAGTPIYLLIGGVGTVGGTLLAGRLIDWKPMHTLFGATLLQAAVFAALLLGLGQHPIAMAVLLFLGGVGIAVFATPVQARIVAAAKAAPNLAAALISTAFNIGIGCGALIGAYLLAEGFGYSALPVVGVIGMILAALTVLVSWRLDRRRLVTA